MEISIGLYLNSYLPCHLNIKRLRYSSNHWELGESFSNGLNKNNWPLMNEGSPYSSSSSSRTSCSIRSDSPSQKKNFECFVSNVSLSEINYDDQSFPIYFRTSGFTDIILHIYIIYIRYNNNVSRLILKKSPFQTNTSKHTFVRLTSTVLEATVFINFFLDEIR